jgi:protein ImuB
MKMLGFAETLSPKFEATSPGMVTIDLSTATFPDGREERHSHAAELLGAAREWCGLDLLFIGLGDSPEKAMLAALRADPVALCFSGEEVGDASIFGVDELRLAELSPDAAIAGVLSSWGIFTVAQLVELPRDAVVRRLGADGAALWDRAAGRGERLLDLERGRKRYLRVQDMEFAITSHEPLLFLLRRILEELLAEMAADYLVVTSMRLVLGFADGDRQRAEMRLPEACCDLELLHRRLHACLDGVSAPAPLEKFSLELLPGRPLGRQRSLFSRGIRDPGRLVDTLAQIEALLEEGGGSAGDSLGCPVLRGDHRPDSFVMHPFAAHVAPEAGGIDFTCLREPQARWGLPLRRLRPPEPIQVRERGRGAVGGRWPAEICSGQFRGKVGEYAGPWLVSGDWWHAGSWQSEEWDVELERGGLLRIVRCRNGRWQLDGIYG